MIDVLLLFFVVVLVTFVFGELFFRFHLSRSIGQIIAGLILGLPFFSGFISVEGNSMILLLSEIGIIFLLILTGLEIDLTKIKGCSRDVVVLAVFSVLVPFALGIAFGLWMGYSLLISFVLGAVLSVTSEATKSIVLMQKKVLKTRLGEIMLLAGVVDDFFELIFLSAILLLVGGTTTQQLIFLPIEIIGFLLAVFIALKLLPKFVSLFKQESDDGYFTLAVLIGLGIALLSNALSLGTIVGAFIAGLLLKKAFKSEKVDHAIQKNLKVVTFALVIPFFHLHIGLNASFQNLVLHPFLILGVLIIAFAGKMWGVLAATPLTDLKPNQLMLVGWGMNSRGFMELIILSIAFAQIPFFPPELYTAIVFTTIITTVAFPIALQYYLKKYPDIMN